MSYQWKPDETDNPNEIALKTCINNKENNPRQDDRWPTMRIRCPTAGAAMAIPSGRVGQGPGKVHEPSEAAAGGRPQSGTDAVPS